MIRDGSLLPVRQATRIVNEFQFRAGSAGLAAAGRHFDRSALLLMILRLALRDPCMTRISMNALASSLGRPRESIRRAGLALAVDSLCETRADGLHRRANFDAAPVIVELRTSLLAMFGAMLDGLERTGFRLPDGIRAGGDDERLAAALDIYLSVFELAEAQVPSLVDLYLIGAITVLNAAAITHDPVLSERYGHATTVPPDELRRPASLHAIAAIDGVPYPTLWRHATAAEKAGALRRVADGYFISKRYMDDPRTNARSAAKIQYVRRVLTDLADGRYR